MLNQCDVSVDAWQKTLIMTTVYWLCLIVVVLVEGSLAFCVYPTTGTSTTSLGFRTYSMSSFRAAPSSEDRLVEYQKDLSSNLLPEPSVDPTKEIGTFLDHQRTVFDEMAEFFASDDATPPEVVPALRHLCQEIIQQTMASRSGSGSVSSLKILDVACGTGALWPFYLEAASAKGITLDIVGVDLSSKMLQRGQERIARLREGGPTSESFGSIDLVHSDFVAMILEDEDSEYKQSFDAAVANACFANFLDRGRCSSCFCVVCLISFLNYCLLPDGVMDALTECLLQGGVAFVTHPLGSSFVEKLHTQDPSTVPHTLPSKEEFRRVTEPRDLQIRAYDEKVVNGQITYLASATKTS